MVKRNTMVLVALLVLVSFIFGGCAKGGGEANASLSEAGNAATVSPVNANATNAQNEPDETVKQDETASPQGESVPSFTVDWPADALPDGFPNLGKVTKVIDFRGYGSEIYIQWNIVSEEEVQRIVDALNEYLDYDHAWQGYFYSDGVKYKEGTEEEILKVEIRYDPSASGEVGESSKPQLTIEISGEGLPKD